MLNREKILNYIEGLETGTPFYIDELFGIASKSTVQKVIRTLVKRGELTRVYKGMYASPTLLAHPLNIRITTSADKIARHWAKKYGHTIASQGEEAAYIVGFQTQAPVKTVFWSSGPSREFRLGNSIVYVRHVANNKLQWIDKPEGVLLRAIYATPFDAIDTKKLDTAFKRLSLQRQDVIRAIHLLKSQRIVRGWIRNLEAYEVLVANRR